jgi:hypothetical protein
MARSAVKKVKPARNITPEPCANCVNPDASGPVCMACRYPRFILDPASKHPGIGCSRCLFLDLEHLDNEHCNNCRSAWPGFVAEEVVSEGRQVVPHFEG